jgi:hypothetical protein
LLPKAAHQGKKTLGSKKGRRERIIGGYKKNKRCGSKEGTAGRTEGHSEEEILNKNNVKTRELERLKNRRYSQ